MQQHEHGWIHGECRQKRVWDSVDGVYRWYTCSLHPPHSKSTLLPSIRADLLALPPISDLLPFSASSLAHHQSHPIDTVLSHSHQLEYTSTLHAYTSTLLQPTCRQSEAQLPFSELQSSHHLHQLPQPDSLLSSRAELTTRMSLVSDEDQERLTQEK